MLTPTVFLPPELAWLPKDSRPSPQEVETYAHLIANAEGDRFESPEAVLQQAELQLWVWNAEQRRRAPVRRRRAAA